MNQVALKNFRVPGQYLHIHITLPLQGLFSRIKTKSAYLKPLNHENINNIIVKQTKLLKLMSLKYSFVYAHIFLFIFHSPWHWMNSQFEVSSKMFLRIISSHVDAPVLS